MVAASILMVSAVATATLGLLYGARAQAVTAADAAALAAAPATYPHAASMGPRAAAALAAEANGASLEGCVCPVDSSLNERRVHAIVAIQVRLPLFGMREVRGRASAEFDPAAWLGRP